MKRLPLAASFLLFLLLCVSLAYWAMQLFKPPERQVTAPPRATADIQPQAAATLFGGQGRAAVASNYQLKGVVMAGTAGESQAILSANGKPAQAVQAGKEVAPGVTVKEVHRNYVLLSDGGVIKRVELPESAKAEVDFATTAPVGGSPAVPGGGGSQAYGAAAAPQPQQQTPANPGQQPPTPQNQQQNQQQNQHAAPGQPAAPLQSPGANLNGPPTKVVRPPAAVPNGQ